ncbi:MAG: acetylxylan esterase [Chloroflexi bacterium]|nr:acetylxylan esterase [Chloroflexota bacterium]
MARFLHRPEDFRVLHAPYSALLEEYYGRTGPNTLRALPYPQTLEEWTHQREVLRRRLIAALGLEQELVDAPADARGDLHARTTGTIDRSRDGYRVELIEFQSQPRFHVSAAMYLPADVPAGTRLPAVFSPHGHWRTGKHTRHIQIRSVNLARRGYAVLVVDTIGHAERTFMGHREPAAHALFYTGASLPGLQVWDNVRALDYLASRPEVDSARIGVTGASGGGNHTMYLAAIDARVAAAIPVCSVEMLEVYFRKSQCVCETVPDLLTFADKPHLLGLIAPRPLLIMNGMRDPGFNTLSARRAFDHTHRIYQLYDGGAERLARYETNVEHSYDRAMRERAYAWLDRWLKRLDPDEAAARSREADTWVEAEEDDTLRVWGPYGAGSVPEDAHTLGRYYAALAGAGMGAGEGEARGEGEWASGREGAGAKVQELGITDIWRPAAGSAGPRSLGPTLRRRIVDEAFGGWPERTPVRAEPVETIERSDCAIELLAYWSEDGVPVPALLFRPRSSPAKRLPAVVYTSPAGKGRTPELRSIHEVVRAGAIVLAIDYRGQGETAGSGGTEGELPAVERGIMLHRPLFGGRVWDVLRGVDYLATRPDVDPAAVSVWGEGGAALLALHAAALDERVAGAACLGLPASYRARAGGSVNLEPWVVVPNLLALADVPDLAALVAPRPLVTGTTAEAAEMVPRLVSR